MKLVVEAPDGWIERELENNAGYELSVADPGRILVRVDPIIGRPDDTTTWASQRTRHNVPDGCDLEVIRERRDRTDLDWPVHYIELELRRDSGSEVVLAQTRLHAFYTFLHYAGHVMAAASPRAFEHHRSTVERLLGRVSADLWPDEIVALDQLWR